MRQIALAKYHLGINFTTLDPVTMLLLPTVLWAEQRRLLPSSRPIAYQAPFK